MPRRYGPTIQRKVNLTPRLSNKVDIFLADPNRRGKVMYGGFAHLVEHLLQEFFEKLEKSTEINDDTNPTNPEEPSNKV
jgi:hypothetical protein